MPEKPKPKTRRRPPAQGVNMNFINLRRAIKGKNTSGGGKRMAQADRRRLISAAVQTVAEHRDVTQAEARRIVRRRALAGKNVGGYTKGAKKGTNEGRKTRVLRQT